MSSLHGDWKTALHESPLGLVLFLAAALALVFNLTACMRRRIQPWPFSRRATRLGLIGLFALASASWIYRLTMGFDR